MSTGIPGDETGQPAVPQQPGYGATPPPPVPPPAPMAGATGQPDSAFAQPAPPQPAGAAGHGSAAAGATGGPAPASKPASSFDAKSVTTPEWLVIGGAVVFLIAMLLPWVSVSLAEGLGIDLSESGFDSSLLVFAFLLLLAAAVWLLLRHFGVRMDLPVPRGVVTLGLTGLALLFVVVKFIDVLTGGDYGDFGADTGTGFGAYLGLLAALAAVAGAVMLFQAERRTGSTT